MLTATVAWILQTYPALSRRRALAHELNLFRRAAGTQGVSALEPGHAAALVDSFARSVATVSIDLLAFNETYYFHEAQQRESLPATVAYAQQLASEAEASTHSDLQFAGGMLHAALDDLAEVLRGKFGHSGQTSSAVFQSYETHHRHRRKRGGTAVSGLFLTLPRARAAARADCDGNVLKADPPPRRAVLCGRRGFNVFVGDAP